MDAEAGKKTKKKHNFSGDKMTNQKANIILDSSKIDLFETCPQRYDYRHNQNKDLPIHKRAEALDKGTLIHEGFGVYYQLLSQGVKYKERCEASMMKIRELSSNPENSWLEPEDVSIVISGAEGSLDYWRAEDENCLEILAVEQPFLFLLFEDEYVRILISGKIDLLVNFHGIGNNASYENLVIDHKSFSRESPVLRLTNQFICYCIAAGSNYLVVNRVGLHDPNVKKPKPAEEKFKRLPLSYDPIYFEQWKQNLITMITQEYLTCVSTGKWPMKPTSCNKFNRLCEYYEVCDSSGQEAKFFKLSENYVDVSPWDVTSKLVKK